jgi:hypothetical protein
MHDDIDAAHTILDQVGIGDRSNVRREWRIKPVQPYDFVPFRLERPNKSLAEMTGASGYKNPHGTD